MAIWKVEICQKKRKQIFRYFRYESGNNKTALSKVSALMFWLQLKVQRMSHLLSPHKKIIFIG